ncbi:unnamed protein product, partial [Iphiclides podalirius]
MCLRSSCSASKNALNRTYNCCIDNQEYCTTNRKGLKSQGAGKSDEQANTNPEDPFVTPLPLEKSLPGFAPEKSTLKRRPGRPKKKSSFSSAPTFTTADENQINHIGQCICFQIQLKIENALVNVFYQLVDVFH